MFCIIPPAPGQPWRVLILDASDPADPKWVIATVTTPAHVRPAGIRAQGVDEITAQWVASASGLHRQVKRCRAGLILKDRITTTFEQAFHRSGTSRADGAVQGCGTIFVLGINLGSGVEQALDGLHLPFCIPSGAVYVAVRGIV